MSYPPTEFEQKHAAALSGTSVSGGAVPQAAPLHMEFPDVQLVFFIRVFIQSVPHYNLSPLFGYFEQDMRIVCQSSDRDAWGNQNTMLFMVKCNQDKFYEVLRRMKVTMRNFGGNPDHIEYYLSGGASKT